MKSAPSKSKVTKSPRSSMAKKSLAFSAMGISDGEKLFEEVLPEICYKHSVSFTIVVKKEFRRDNYLRQLKASSRVTKPKKNVVMPLGPPSQEDQKIIETVPSHHSIVDSTAKVVTAVYDDMNNKLCEVSISRMKCVPRALIQVIFLLAPNYDHLTKITISRSQTDVYTIYEMHKYLSETNVTEVCLDESPLAEGIFALLLDNGTNLKNLSLSRCKINDTICYEIASKLRFSEEAGKKLQVLDLSSNHITDAGAKQISDALRTNRTLRFLNLANNNIGDEGAIQIFNALNEFPLTEQELASKRFRYVMYLKTYMQYYSKYLQILMEEDAAVKQKKNIGKKKYSPEMSSFMKTRAEAMARQALGSFNHPFAAQKIVRCEGSLYCRGNYVLCYLNLAYNDLSYLSVKSLLTVVTYQSLVLNFSDIGLLRVIIDGNNIPDSCSELITISVLINKNLSRFSSTPITLNRRKSRMSKTSLAQNDISPVKTNPETGSVTSKSTKKSTN